MLSPKSKQHLKLSEERKCSILVTAMNLMRMKKQEKGSISREQRFKSLLGRWFGEEKKVNIEGGGTETLLERGLVVTLKGSNLFFIIYVVWRDNRSKKWFPT